MRRQCGQRFAGDGAVTAVTDGVFQLAPNRKFEGSTDASTKNESSRFENMRSFRVTLMRGNWNHRIEGLREVEAFRRNQSSE